MPTRVHAKMLVTQLERAESVVKDLFLEATDDGIEALEAVLLACCKEVLAKGPKVRPEVAPTAMDDGGRIAAGGRVVARISARAASSPGGAYPAKCPV